jgi:hypothetical protein
MNHNSTFLRSLLVSAAIPVALLACGAPASPEASAEQGSDLLKKCTVCGPALPVCGGEGQPGCGPQQLGCNVSLVPSFKPQQTSSGSWVEVPGTCVSNGSMSGSIVASVSLDATNTILIVDVLAQAMATGPAGPVDVPFVMNVSAPGLSWEYGPFLPNITGGSGTFQFEVPPCATYTISLSTLDGLSWKRVTVSPPMSFLNDDNGLCCDDRGTFELCSGVTVVSGSTPGGGGGGSSGGSNNSGTGGDTWCQTKIPCFQDCMGSTFPLGNFCDQEDAAAAANNGCDVFCQ